MNYIQSLAGDMLGDVTSKANDFQQNVTYAIIHIGERAVLYITAANVNAAHRPVTVWPCTSMVDRRFVLWALQRLVIERFISLLADDESPHLSLKQHYLFVLTKYISRSNHVQRHNQEDRCLPVTHLIKLVKDSITYVIVNSMPWSSRRAVCVDSTRHYMIEVYKDCLE